MGVVKVATKIFGMFDRVDDIIYEPIKLVCDALRQPLKQIDASNVRRQNEQEQNLQIKLKQFEADLEDERKKRDAELSAGQRRIDEEINQLMRDNDLKHREEMIRIEESYRKEMAEAATQLAAMMVNLNVEARGRLLDLYEEKTRSYMELQDQCKRNLFSSVKDMREMFPDGSFEDEIRAELRRGLEDISTRSSRFSQILLDDQTVVLKSIDAVVSETMGLAAKYFQPPQPKQPALTQNIVDQNEG